MSKIPAEFKKYLGYKLYKENEDGSLYIIRILNIDTVTDRIYIKDLNTLEKSFIPYSKFKQGLTPLIPMGIISFSRVSTNTPNGDRQNDVIIALHRMIDIEMGNATNNSDLKLPYAICRQAVNDFFYTIIKNSNEDLYGVSTTREECPTNIPYHLLMGCDDVMGSDVVNYYIDDTLDDILECIDTRIYDAILNSLLQDHIKATKQFMKKDNESVDGWCRSLRKLLIENNFVNDFDTARNITAVDFEIKDYLQSKEEENILELNHDTLLFLNISFKINAVDTYVIKYDLDIAISDFNNTNYILLRDSTNALYIIVYKCQGEYLENELIAEANKLDVTTRLRLAYYNKYGNQ